MKKHRRKIVLFLAVFSLFLMTSCGNKAKDNSKAKPSSATETVNNDTDSDEKQNETATDGNAKKDADASAEEKEDDKPADNVENAGDDATSEGEASADEKDSADANAADTAAGNADTGNTGNTGTASGNAGAGNAASGNTANAGSTAQNSNAGAGNTASAGNNSAGNGSTSAGNAGTSGKTGSSGNGITASIVIHKAETAADKKSRSGEFESDPTYTYVAYSDGGGMRSGMTAMDYAKDLGIGINLGNTFEAYYPDKKRRTGGSSDLGSATNYETCWGAITTSQSIIDGMKAAGFKHVRIPVYWGNMMKDDGNFNINPAYFARIDQVVEYCRKDGLYVVINMHHFDEYLIHNYDQDQVYNITRHVWNQIAEHYKNCSDYVIFEGFNENLGAYKDDTTLSENKIYEYVNQMNQIFVDTVRATGGNNAKRILICSGYWTNIDKTSDSRFKMPTDTVSDKLMVSVHYVDNSMYWENQIGNQVWLDYIYDQCEKLRKAFTTKNIPVYMGETTTSYSGRFASNATYKTSTECDRIVLEELHKYGFVPVYWDTCDRGNPAKSFYNRSTCRIQNSGDAEMILEYASNW